MTDPLTPKLCPKGHQTGTAFGGGRRCSAKSCGKERYELALKEEAKPFVPKMDPTEVEYLKRKALARIPEEALGDDQATEWAKGKLTQMLPEAVAQVQWDLRYGSDKVRSEAAQKVLAANGMDKREAAVTRVTPQIIVNIGTGDTKAPWLERLKRDVKKEGG